MNKKYIEPELKVTYFHTDVIMDNEGIPVISESNGMFDATNLLGEDKEVKTVTGIQWADLK